MGYKYFKINLSLQFKCPFYILFIYILHKIYYLNIFI